jgi:hypothetical protein
MAKRHRTKEAFKAMGLRSFFGEDRQRTKLEHLGDPLVPLAKMIPWESFRETLSTLYEKERKGPAGRKPIDVVLMFKILILQRLYNLSDDQTEYQIRDRGRRPGACVKAKYDWQRSLVKVARPSSEPSECTLNRSTRWFNGSYPKTITTTMAFSASRPTG